MRRAPILLACLALVLPIGGTAHAAGRTQDVTWHGKQIKAYDAQSAGRSGANVLVAVLDSWVDRSHPDFEGRALVGADCTSGTCRAGQTKDGCTHGTHVAGTVASSSFGIAPKARILPVRVLTEDSNGDCTSTPDVVAAGIRYAVVQGARVLNLSLGPDVPGLSSSSAIPTAVDEAAKAGAVVVFSAGNADLPVAQAYGDNALVVAATGPSGRLATYSQHGQGVSVAAPGGQPDANDQCTQATCITSLYPGGQYAVAAGTSMAAPHVSGIAALLFGQRPSRSRQDVLDRITSTAHPLAGAGSGLVDAKAALGVSTAATPTRTTSPTPRPVATTRAPVTATSPTPIRVPSPRASATAAPTPTTLGPSPVATPSPVEAAPTAVPSEVVAAPDTPASDDGVPGGVGVLAGALVAGSAGALVATRRRWS